MFAIRQARFAGSQLFLARIASNARKCRIANNVDAYRFGALEKTTDTESGIETEVISNA